MDQPTPILDHPPQAPSPQNGRRLWPVYSYRSPRLLRSESPIVTRVILTINLIAFLLTTLAGGLTSADVLLDCGASYGPYIRAGEYWRIITAMFLHGGIGHLALNMFGLY